VTTIDDISPPALDSLLAYLEELEPDWLGHADLGDLRALEYWERGHRHETRLAARVLAELRSRGALPHWAQGQVPGRRGALAAIRNEARR
jgi:hypothetical protein